jgi:hypothetical protein
MRRPRPPADSARVIARIATLVAVGLLLVGCSSEEGLRAQELLQQAETAQAQLRSSTFEGAVGITADGEAFKLLLNGKTSGAAEWLSMQTVGAPDGAEMTMQMLVRDGRAWVNADGRWQSAPLPGAGGSAAGSGGKLSAGAFQQLARHVRDVRVSEHELIAGKPVTTIAGAIDTEGMLESLTDLDSSSFAEGFPLDFSKLGIEIGDIQAVLTVDERTHLLDTATVALSMSAQGKRMQLELRYRLTSANEPVSLPPPPS